SAGHPKLLFLASNPSPSTLSCLSSTLTPTTGSSVSSLPMAPRKNLSRKTDNSEAKAALRAVFEANAPATQMPAATDASKPASSLPLEANPWAAEGDTSVRPAASQQQTTTEQADNAAVRATTINVTNYYGPANAADGNNISPTNNWASESQQHQETHEQGRAQEYSGVPLESVLAGEDRDIVNLKDETRLERATYIVIEAVAQAYKMIHFLVISPLSVVASVVSRRAATLILAVVITGATAAVAATTLGGYAPVQLLFSSVSGIVSWIWVTGSPDPMDTPVTIAMTGMTTTTSYTPVITGFVGKGLVDSSDFLASKLGRLDSALYASPAVVSLASKILYPNGDVHGGDPETVELRWHSASSEILDESAAIVKSFYSDLGTELRTLDSILEAAERIIREFEKERAAREQAGVANEIPNSPSSWGAWAEQALETGPFEARKKNIIRLIGWLMNTVRNGLEFRERYAVEMRDLVVQMSICRALLPEKLLKRGVQHMNRRFVEAAGVEEDVIIEDDDTALRKGGRSSIHRDGYQPWYDYGMVLETAEEAQVLEDLHLSNSATRVLVSRLGTANETLHDYLDLLDDEHKMLQSFLGKLYHEKEELGDAVTDFAVEAIVESIANDISDHVVDMRIRYYVVSLDQNPLKFSETRTS
ncbi:hypothetical protein QBC47DRAFT_439742, partial [Echria macrotheca]